MVTTMARQVIQCGATIRIWQMVQAGSENEAIRAIVLNPCMKNPTCGGKYNMLVPVELRERYNDEQ